MTLMYEEVSEMNMYYHNKRKRVKRPDTPRLKAAILKACPSVVGLVTHHVPSDMVHSESYYYQRTSYKFVFMGSGLILDTHLDTTSTSTSPSYVTTILAPAVLFKRTDHTQPSQVQFDVYVTGGKKYKGELLVCDFHYNIAAVRIQSDSLLKPATFRALNDVSSIHVDSDKQPQLRDQIPFQLRPHSFKVQSGTNIIILRCSFQPSFSVLADCGVFRASPPSHYSCKELYWVDPAAISGSYSVAVINLSGEFLGIMSDYSDFLPSNFISRWWNYYTSKGELCRPWVGVQISNLAEAPAKFLQQFRNAFPDVGTGVIVTKVKKDTPAYNCGIQLKDVIVKCDGKQIESKIGFFESMWENAGKSVQLTALRASDHRLLEFGISIEETPPTELYWWMLPSAIGVAELSSEDEEDDDELLDTSSDDASDSTP